MKIYITFGQDHIHSIDGELFDKDCVAIIHADNHEKGKEIAFKYFRGKFCFSCTEESWKPENIKNYPRGYVTLGVGTYWAGSFFEAVPGRTGVKDYIWGEGEDESPEFRFFNENLTSSKQKIH